MGHHRIPYQDASSRVSVQTCNFSPSSGWQSFFHHCKSTKMGCWAARAVPALQSPSVQSLDRRCQTRLGNTTRFTPQRACSFSLSLYSSLRVLGHSPLRATVVSGAYAPPDHTLVVSQGATTTQIPLSSAQLLEVKGALSAIIKVFAEKAAWDGSGGAGIAGSAGVPKKWESVDVCVKEETKGVRVELFCNPNACVNAFEAKVLLTVRDCTSGLRVVTECGFEELKSSYKVCVEEM